MVSEFAFEGQRWQSTTITWSFEFQNYAVGQPSYFSHSVGDATEQAVVAAAAADWATATGLHLVQIPDTGTPANGADIRVGFGFLSGGAGLDLLGLTSYYPQGASFVPGITVQLQDPTYDPISYDPSGTLRYADGASLYQVISHEIGHALGLAHTTDPTTLMYPYASPSDPQISGYDALGVRTLYGTLPSGTATVDYRLRGVVAASGLAVASVIYLNNGNDYYSAGGQDTVACDSGNDTVAAANGNVLAFGGSGGLTFFAGTAASEVVGGSGLFIVQGGAGPLAAFGGIGATRITGGFGAGQVLVGGSADSQVLGQGTGDVLVAGSGNATLEAAGGDSTVFGNGSGVIVTSDRPALVVGGSGAETIGAGAHTTLYFGAGPTTVDLAAAAPANLVGARDILVGFDPTRDQLFANAGGGAVVQIVPAFSGGLFYQNLSDGVLLAVFAAHA